MTAHIYTTSYILVLHTSDSDLFTPEITGWWFQSTADECEGSLQELLSNGGNFKSGFGSVLVLVLRDEGKKAVGVST